MTLLSRRAALAGAGALLATPAATPAFAQSGPAARLAAIEREVGGRLGVAALAAGSGARIGHRADERFATCSVSKVFQAAFALARVDRGEDALDARVAVAEADLLAYAPVTKQHVATGMTLAQVCEAAITLSDNTAANLLLARFGGPAALTAYLRGLGDGTTRFDRTEPTLNEAEDGVPGGDPRDTSTPAATVDALRRVALEDGSAGPALAPASRAQLVAWLVDCRTGGKRLRAGLPAGWRVGDKTGTGPRWATNDVAVLWPPADAGRERAPIVVAAFLTETRAAPERRDAALAEVGRVVAEWGVDA